MSGRGGFSVPFCEVYAHLLAWLLASPSVRNERTGTVIRAGRGGTSFRLDLSDGLLPTPGLRRVYPRSAAAEVAWFLQGTQDAEFITKYAPLWDKFTEPLPTTPSMSQYVYSDTFDGVKAAYGHRWRRHFGRDQLALAIRALQEDPSDRRVNVSAWDPASDGLGAPGKNVPCPTAFTLSLLDGELHSTLSIRSSDVFVGLPYDVMGHALLMAAVAAELGVRPGVAQFALAHPHLYQAHWDMAEECLRQAPVVPWMPLPPTTIAQVESMPHEYVAFVAEASRGVTWPEYAPRPEVVA